MQNKGCGTLGIVGGIVGVLIILAISFFSVKNTIVTKDEQCNNAWSNLETQYQRRADLVPQLVNTVKGAVGAEKGILTDVMNARAKATSVTINSSNPTAEQMQNYESAQSGLTHALGKLMVVVEKYPDLKSIQGFDTLQSQLEGTENRISFSRQDYNEQVKGYNSYVRQFPGFIVAYIEGDSTKPYYTSDAGSEKAPKVDFGTDGTGN